MVKKTSLAGAIALAACVGCNAIAGIEPASNGDDSALAGEDPTYQAPDTPAPTPTSVSDAGTTQTSSSCDAVSKACGGRCVAKNDPSFGCSDSACQPCAVRHAQAACAGTACVVSACTPGFADCNGNPSDGCEIDLSLAAHCGACNAACPQAAPFCVPGAAGFACGTGCPGVAPTLCGTTCVDATRDLRNCGRCGSVCPVPTNAAATCNSGACGFTCATGAADCDKNAANGCEAILATDPANCGACGNACVAPQTCQAGMCK